MTFETRFDPRRNMILVDGEVAGPLGATSLRLAVDTGSAETLVIPEILDALGYSALDGDVLTGVYSAVGKEQGYMLHVARFTAMGIAFTPMLVHAFDLPEHYRIDGLVGLRFLRQFNYEIRSAEGRILLDPI